MTIDWTNIILAVLTLIGGCGWIVNRRKYRQEVRSVQGGQSAEGYGPE